MNFEHARVAVLGVLRQQDRAKNSELMVAVGNDEDLWKPVREDLSFNDLAEANTAAALASRR